MDRQDHRAAVPGDFGKGSHHDIRRHGVQARGRLVSQEHGRPGDELDPHREPPALAA